MFLSGITKFTLFFLCPICAFFTLGADWDGLEVTWSSVLYNPWAFDSLPRTVNVSEPELSQKDDQCAKGSKFLGKRYWYKSDPAVVLLYDKNGYISGIQTSVPKLSYTPSADLVNRSMVDDGDYWTITAYFIEPSKICTEGRTEEEFIKEGTGTGLWFQNGTNPLEDLIKIPMTEGEINQTNWKFGQCFYTMGKHYWYNVSVDMDCGQLFPACLLYNTGKLTAFCFAISAYLPSIRYEHPTPHEVTKMMQPVPECLFNQTTYGKLSTLHVYMIENARIRSWC